MGERVALLLMVWTATTGERMAFAPDWTLAASGGFELMAKLREIRDMAPVGLHVWSGEYDVLDKDVNGKACRISEPKGEYREPTLDEVETMFWERT